MQLKFILTVSQWPKEMLHRGHVEGQFLSFATYWTLGYAQGRLVYTQKTTSRESIRGVNNSLKPHGETVGVWKSLRTSYVSVLLLSPGLLGPVPRMPGWIKPAPFSAALTSNLLLMELRRSVSSCALRCYYLDYTPPAPHFRRWMITSLHSMIFMYS